MAEVDQYYTSATISNIMADLPSFNQLSPCDLSEYHIFDELAIEQLMDDADYSTEATPIVAEEQQPGSAAEVCKFACQQQSASYVESVSCCSKRTMAPLSDQHRAAKSHRIAFRTKSEVDVMDDGFRWRKYGRKSVKNSANPRNYYRCSTEGCSVKKRVERDASDARYVITTYEGVHNHTSPDVVYYATQDAESGRFVVSGCHPIDRSS